MICEDTPEDLKAHVYLWGVFQAVEPQVQRASDEEGGGERLEGQTVILDFGFYWEMETLAG